MNILLACIIGITPLPILIVFHKRLTIPFGVVVLCAFGAIPFVLTKNIFTLAVPIITIGLFVYFKFYYPELNFDKGIFSIHVDKNKIRGEGRIIGKCLPYYKDQLKYNKSTIVQNDISCKGGTIITGSSGSGKTYSIVNFIEQDLSLGKNVAFFDFKGDMSTVDEIAEKGHAWGKDVYILTYNSCDFSYDPLENLDTAGRVEAILNMRKWSLDGSDAHYKTGVQLFLQETIHAFEEIRKHNKNFLVEYYDYLSQLNVPREQYDSYNTTIKLIELTLTSNVKQMFEKGEREFNFSSNNFVLIVAFTSATKSLGTAITSLIFRDLMETGTRNAYSPDLCLYVDEFGSCENTLIVKDILEKGRSCNIATAVSMQDLNQLIINTNAPFMDSVLGTCNSFIVFAGSTRQTAEKLAGTQIYDIENLLISLRKPVSGRPPTAMYISKYPIFEKSGLEVYRFIPAAKSIKLKGQLISDMNEVHESEQETKQEVHEEIVEQRQTDELVSAQTDNVDSQTLDINDLDQFL